MDDMCARQSSQMSEHRETIIALRARRMAFKVANDLMFSRGKETPVAGVAPSDLSPFADEVLAECDRYHQGQASLSDVRVVLWRFVQAMQQLEQRSAEEEARAIIIKLENIELHMIANPKIEKQKAIERTEIRMREVRETLNRVIAATHATPGASG
jgi:hypothetical protein